MKQFPPDELIEFLRKTDQFLASDCELIVIGGAAASLAYGASRTTTDIDTVSKLSEDLQFAFESARQQTGISIPVTYVGVFDPPYGYEDRLQILENPKLNLLHVSVPEQHDLALMKIVRGDESDIQAIMDMHRAFPFNLDVLVERFMTEMTQVIGNPRMIKLGFLATVEALFGPEALVKVKKITEKWAPLHNGK